MRFFASKASPSKTSELIVWLIAVRWVAALPIPAVHWPKCNRSNRCGHGTHDIHYVLDIMPSLMLSSKLPRVDANRTRIASRTRARRNPDGDPNFHRSILADTTPLATVAACQISGAAETSRYPSKAKTKSSSAELATNNAPEIGSASRAKVWEKVECKIRRKSTAEGLPLRSQHLAGALTDDRGAMVSTEVGFR